MRGKVLTANRVLDGEAVFFTAQRSWSPRIDDALVASSDPALQLLDGALSETDKGTEVTDAYIFEADSAEGTARPLQLRERIRTLGPTVRADLGKQSDGTGGGFAALGQERNR